MGKETTIYTGGTRRYISLHSTNTGGLGKKNSLSSSSGGFEYGVVIAINPTTKEIVYNPMENNLGNIQGRALPLYKNNIQLPDIGYIVPLVKGPRADSNILANQYSKTVYYLNPVGILQTVDSNQVYRESNISPISNELNVSSDSINQAIIGIPNINFLKNR